VDGGKSVSHLRHFPQPGIPNDLDYDLIQINNQHVIKLMAFSDDGQYAFLTSKRELWLGNSGSDKQIRIRPSNGYSMLDLELYKNRPGISQAVPFSIMFDTFNHLFEVSNGFNLRIIPIIRAERALKYSGVILFLTCQK